MTDLELLMDGAANGHLQTVKELLDRHPQMVNERSSTGATALHYAAIHGCSAMVKLLVERGGDINARDAKWGATPAGWAIEHMREMGGHLAIELEDLAYAIRNRNRDWVSRFLTRFRDLREGVYKDQVTFRQLAVESADPEIMALFGEGPGS